jgi:3-oxoacyl-[acyl-carrier-protein] synthase II
MIAGGSEAAITPMGVGGFAAMRALSTRNDEPQRASRPFDKERDGFVMGEGAGVVVLEELRARQARGARIYCRAGRLRHVRRRLSHHRAVGRRRRRVPRHAQRAEGRRGRRRATSTTSTRTAPRRRSATSRDARDQAPLRRARAQAGDVVDQVDDRPPARRRRRARGGITALAIRDQIAPPTINLRDPDPECDLDYVPNAARKMPIRYALSNSFGFGGTNATLTRSASAARTRR